MILAIRSDSERAEIYLLDQHGKRVKSKKWLAGHKLSVQLLASIDKLLQQAKVKPTDLTGLIVYEGPGGFTSLRIGVATANTMAFGLGVPIVGSTGTSWLEEGVAKLSVTKAGKFVIPQYGQEPNISKPRK